MSKIRINELARELEVKPNVILETLAELGIADKKTHSSSLDDDVALLVRRRVTGDSEPAVSRVEESAPTPEPVRAQPSSKPSALKAEAPVAESGVKETQETKTADDVPAAPARLAPPLRPPLSTGQFSPPSMPLPHPAPPRAAPPQ